jgi:hypothetical protein
MLLVVFVALCHGAGAARADDGLVLIGGTAGDPMRAAATAAVEDAATQAGWSLATKRMSRKETDGLLRCMESSPFTCLPSALTAGGIYRMLVVTVDRTTSDAAASDVVLSGKIIVTSSRDIVVDRRFCESCAGDRLAKEAALLAENLLRLLATQSNRTMVAIRSEPTGAQIVLDGQRIGLTNSSFLTYPGKHRVTLERDGYQPETVEVPFDEDTIARISLTLRASSVPARAPPPAPTKVSVQHRPERRSLATPTALIAVGTVVTLGGIALHAMDQAPSRRGRGDEHYRNTAPAGIVLGMAGLAASAAGVYLWWRRDF